MSDASLLNRLIEALRCLPGVGPKSAQRMAFHLLERDREGGRKLSETIEEAVTKIGHCELCRTLTENPLCDVCNNDTRDRAALCVVETPAEAAAMLMLTS